MENRLVRAHLVQIDWPVKQEVKNPCSEIALPGTELMEPFQILKLRLMGIPVFDLTESLNMDPELVHKDSCYSPWQSTIPVVPKSKDVKRCYTVWSVLLDRWRSGGKVVWLTDAQLTFARIKYPKKEFRPVLERDLLEEYKKYINQTIE